MKRYVPSYYPKFHCIASACQHSCCVGWEVDIDEESAEHYRTMEGELGERLHSSIEWDDTPHFRLSPEERCPFLNGENLCDLILDQGEGALCQICTDHPRYRSWFADRVEEGLGLCCEEAARLMLTEEAPIALVEQEIEGDVLEAEEDYLQLLRQRDALWQVLQNREKPLQQRMEEACSLCDIALAQRTLAEDVELLLGLEGLEESWKTDLEALVHLPDTAWQQEWDRDGEHLLWYILFRYYLSWGLSRWEEDFALRFGVCSVRLLGGLYHLTLKRKGKLTLEDRVEHLRRWSAELEYSEENLDAIADALA